MLTGEAGRRVFRMIPSECNKLFYGYVRRCFNNHDNYPKVIIQMMVVYGCLLKTLNPIITSIIVSKISNDIDKTREMLLNLIYILQKQGPKPWPVIELLEKLSYILMI